MSVRHVSLLTILSTAWGKCLHGPSVHVRTQAHRSWGHRVAQRPAAIWTLHPQTWTPMPRQPLYIGRHKQQQGMAPVTSPAQPAPWSSCGPFRVMVASSWLWPHVASSPQGSDSSSLSEGTKASLLAPSLETLTSCCISGCLDWLLPWQLTADLCPIMSAQTEGPLCPFPAPACQPSPSDLRAALIA